MLIVGFRPCLIRSFFKEAKNGIVSLRCKSKVHFAMVENMNTGLSLTVTQSTNLVGIKKLFYNLVGYIADVTKEFSAFCVQ